LVIEPIPNRVCAVGGPERDHRDRTVPIGQREHHPRRVLLEHRFGDRADDRTEERRR